jgi:hypothetical protein
MSSNYNKNDGGWQSLVAIAQNDLQERVRVRKRLGIVVEKEKLKLEKQFMKKEKKIFYTA